MKQNSKRKETSNINNGIVGNRISTSFRHFDILHQQQQKLLQLQKLQKKIIEQQNIIKKLQDLQKTWISDKLITSPE